MSDRSDIPRIDVDALRAQLERSREDIAAGRTANLQGVLTAMHGRATRRMAKRRSTARQQASDLG